MKKSILGLLLTFTLLCVGSVFANGTDIQKPKTVYEQVFKKDTVFKLTVACFENSNYQNSTLNSNFTEKEVIFNVTDNTEFLKETFIHQSDTFVLSEYFKFRPNKLNSLSLKTLELTSENSYRRARDGLTKSSLLEI